LKEIPVRVRIPDGMRLREVTLKSPDDPTPLGLKFSMADNVASVRVPRLNVYDLLLFRMEAQ